MKITLINGSPKLGESTSGLILEYLKPLIEKSTICEYNINKNLPTNEQFNEICSSDRLVFAFPLYIDSIPSHLLRLLIELEQRLQNNKKEIIVYCLIVNGFYEGHQNNIAVETMKNWCKRADIVFGRAIGNGAGEMLPLVKDIPIGHGPNKNLGYALKEISQNILNGESGEALYISPNWPRFLWKIQGSTLVYHPRAKSNGVKIKHLLNRL
ncbi:hypothetical protein QOZ83_13225 [Romboutsia sedimentorum]|uniref:hypothetical protein n=1 Tax=Romboutsia sedimentorum TaxID=1368474 RepID=UPI0024DE070A|nr:hypothetical protein [Romboutsia sedimentorum]MDK2586820.1 hypothetical protein [Romboutsia sedimentorum]